MLSITVSISAEEIGQDIFYGLVSGFLVEAKGKVEQKKDVNVRFSFQESNFSLPTKQDTEVTIS